MEILTRLKIKKVKEHENCIYFKIDEQSQNITQQRDLGHIIVYRGNIKIRSCACPDWNSNTQTLHIRGYMFDRSNDVIRCKKHEYNIIKRNVEKVNSNILY